MAGLALLLLVAVGMTLLGKLTQELVEVLKWVGASFMAVRAAANASENIKGKPDAS
jgi:threonine/homoserine/homoserine lactone efflux protein